MFTIFPKSVRIVKSALRGIGSGSGLYVSRSAKATASPSKKVIGLFYNMHKSPLNYLFSLLKKARKSADDKEIIKDIMVGLRKMDKSFMKEHSFKDSILDLLIDQRELTLPRG